MIAKLEGRGAQSQQNSQTGMQIALMSRVYVSIYFLMLNKVLRNVK